MQFAPAESWSTPAGAWVTPGTEGDSSSSRDDPYRHRGVKIEKMWDKDTPQRPEASSNPPQEVFCLRSTLVALP